MASSSKFWSTSSLNLRMQAWRSKGVNRLQGPSKALRAAATASSMSSASPSHTRARSLPVAGLCEAKVRPDRAGTNLPSISSGLTAVSVAAVSAPARCMTFKTRLFR